uniref:Uncharacterized protein n=1 Tax=Rhizophora mucronata TaxID=61149 RepID=A0A2P2K3S8_RHIMU
MASTTFSMQTVHSSYSAFQVLFLSSSLF